MALTKITGQVVDTTTDLVVGVTTVGGGVSAVDGFFSGITTISSSTESTSSTTGSLIIAGGVGIAKNLSIGGSVSIGGTLTYEDVTNVDSVGLITARDGIVVGSGITLSKDGDGFYTGVVTATTFSGAFSGDGSALTGVANTDVIFSDKISFPDSTAGSINVGLSSDLQIYHTNSGNQSFIKASGTKLTIASAILDINNAADDEIQAKFTQDGAVELYHNNIKKIETASGGVTVTGTVAATSYTGDGSSLTGISVGIATTSSQVSGITTVIDLNKDDIRLDCSGLVTIDTKGGTEGSSHMLRIVNSGIATVSFNSYFKFPSGGTPALPTASGAISLITFSVHTQGRVGVASVFLAGSSVNFS